MTTPAPNDDLLRLAREYRRTMDKDVLHSWAEEAAAAIEAQAERISVLERAHDTLRRQSTDRAYMLEAYRNMLGPKGLEVAGMWATRGVQRVHFDWSESAGDMTGEDRAQAILDFEKAPRREVDPREIDGDLPRSTLTGAR